jgi:hypothetical protein
MSNVFIKMRPARFVESAAAPSKPMPFSLREIGRKGPQEVYIDICDYKYNVIMTKSSYHHDCVRPISDTHKAIRRPDTPAGRADTPAGPADNLAGKDSGQ